MIIFKNSFKQNDKPKYLMQKRDLESFFYYYSLLRNLLNSCNSG